MVNSFREIIDIWKPRSDLASDIGVEAAAAAKWHQRNYIPPEYWLALIKAAKGKGRVLTADRMVRIAAKRREAPAA